MSGPRLVYTPAEAAELARVSATTIRDAYRSGRLRVVRPGGNHRHPKILHADLMRWIEGLPPREEVSHRPTSLEADGAEE